MQIINDIPSLQVAINAFCVNFGQNLPTKVASPTLQGNPRQLLIDTVSAGSVVPQICDTAEILYAYRDELSDAPTKAAAMTLAAQCAIYAAQPGIQWHGMGAKISDEDGAPSRGVAIMWAMQRELGEVAPVGTAFPSKDKDPAPDARFVAAPVEAEPQSEG